MERQSVERVSERVLNRIEKGLELQEEQRVILWEYALEQMRTPGNETQGVPLRNFSMLREHVQKKWMRDEIGELAPESAFAYGELWAVFQLMDLADRKGKEKYCMESLKKQFRNYYELFHLLKASPGIRHKEIAEKMQKSPSEISQIFSKLNGEQLFSAVKLGREKYYYLEERGNQLLEELGKERAAGSVLAETKLQRD